jgi:hypothetical protein
MEPSQRSDYCGGVCVCVANLFVEICAKLESGDLEMLGQVGRPLDTPSKGKTVDLFFQFESPVKLSEVCSKYEQLGQLVGVQTQRLVALQESGTNDDFSKQYDVLFTMQEFPSVDALLSWMKKEVPTEGSLAEDDAANVGRNMC